MQLGFHEEMIESSHIRTALKFSISKYEKILKSTRIWNRMRRIPELLGGPKRAKMESLTKVAQISVTLV